MSADRETSRTDWTTRAASSRIRRVDLSAYLLLVPLFLIVVVPIAWYALLALKSRIEIANNPLGFPRHLEWHNFVKAWTTGRFSIYLPNTVFYAVCIVVSVCVISCLSGYALARVRLPRRGLITTLVLMGLAIPFQALMIPVYFLIRDLGLLGSRLGLMAPVVAMALPFGTFLMSAFFRTIPSEIADAAKMDGANEWDVFLRVMLPLARPGLVSLAVFEFVWSWNLFLPALVLTQSDSQRPIALGLLLFTGRYSSDRGLVAAGVIVTIVPVIVFYLFAQRRLIQGITAGALK